MLSVTKLGLHISNELTKSPLPPFRKGGECRFLSPPFLKGDLGGLFKADCSGKNYQYHGNQQERPGAHAPHSPPGVRAQVFPGHSGAGLGRVPSKKRHAWGSAVPCLPVPGAAGVGKASVARALAAALNCTQPAADGDACGACPSCRRLAAGTHPDFLVISPEESKAQIGIEKIRELRRLTDYPPLGGGWRVVLIKPAEALTVQNDAAANALLKTLEEPPPQHLLVLTARGEADLLPTIVSRCHKLAFAPLPSALIIQELERRRSLPRSQAALVAALSGGSWAGPWPWTRMNWCGSETRCSRTWPSCTRVPPAWS